MDRGRKARVVAAPVEMPPGAGIAFALILSAAFWALVAALIF